MSNFVVIQRSGIPGPGSSVLQPIADAAAASATAAANSAAALANPRLSNLADTNRNRVLIPPQAVYENNAANQTGSIKIRLPAGATSRRISMEVVVFDQYGMLTFTISGTNNPGAWAYPTVSVRGYHSILAQHPVRFGNDGVADCIYIGDLSYSYWTFLTVDVISATISGNTITEAWMGNWAISLATSYGTITAGPLTAVQCMPSVNPTFMGTINSMVLRSPSSDAATYCGFQAGQSVSGTSLYNHLFGYQVGASLTSGFNNCGFGLQVLSIATTAQACTGMGTQALQNITTAQQATAFGIHALLNNSTGFGNVAVGAGCMEYTTTGEQNTAIGTYAGRGFLGGPNITGSRNIFIGQRAGLNVGAGDDQLWIGSVPDSGGNADSDALIRGDMALGKVWVNGTFKAKQLLLSALNTAPLSSSATGVLGEIRIDASYIYICVATNTWKRSPLTTW